MFALALTPGALIGAPGTGATGFAGFPMIITFAGYSRMHTAPKPTTEFFPIRVPAKIAAPWLIHTFSAMCTGTVLTGAESDRRST